MIDYIGDIIKASTGENTCIVAKAKDAYGEVLEACYFCLFNGSEKILMVAGELNEEEHWMFHIPAEVTENLRGSYTYCVCDKDMNSLCYRNPIYFL